MRVTLFCLLLICSSAHAFDVKTFLVLSKADTAKQAEGNERQRIWYGCQKYGEFVLQLAQMRDDSIPLEVINESNFTNQEVYGKLNGNTNVTDIWKLETIKSGDLRDAAVAVCIEAEGETTKFRTLYQFTHPTVRLLKKKN